MINLQGFIFSNNNFRKVCSTFDIPCSLYYYYYYYYFLNPRKNEGGKKLRKVERGLKWKTSPGGPQRENRRAAIRR